LAQIVGFWVACGVKMGSLRHGWGWQLPQIASCIQHRHIQSVWAHYYAVHWHAVVDLHSYTHPTWLRLWDMWSLVESKWCHYIMVEADSHLTPNSHIHTWHIQSVWAHWYAVHQHKVAALHSYTHNNWPIFGGSGSLVETKWCNYGIIEADSHLKLLPTSIFDIYKVFEHNDMLSIGIW